MGRHSILDSHEVKNASAIRGAAIAGAVGVLAGAGIPAATADSYGSTDATKAVSAAAVELSAVAEVETQNTTVALGSASAGEWELAALDVEAEAAPEPVETVQAQGRVAGISNTRAAGNSQASSAPIAANPSASAIVNIARQYAGAPYVSGGTTPAGWDCSGFTQYVFAQAGISLPRTSGAQGAAGRTISASEARPGDLVVWAGHVGIYTGNGQHIAARRPGVGTLEGPLYGSYRFVRIGG